MFSASISATCFLNPPSLLEIAVNYLRIHLGNNTVVVFEHIFSFAKENFFWKLFRFLKRVHFLLTFHAGWRQFFFYTLLPNVTTTCLERAKKKEREKEERGCYRCRKKMIVFRNEKNIWSYYQTRCNYTNKSRKFNNNKKMKKETKNTALQRNFLSFFTIMLSDTHTLRQVSIVF